ncbi:hypothetical protein INT45_000785 [Circinella minor]|uniref:Uncharacterized protein n=1 Tax=Circinella minor TaxID=1195481 RepID=A0A8H7VEM2_9FUNG|nr:hypothetical protein INT45_000785 [Circinella minor]
MKRKQRTQDSQDALYDNSSNDSVYDDYYQCVWCTDLILKSKFSKHYELCADFHEKKERRKKNDKHRSLTTNSNLSALNTIKNRNVSAPLIASVSLPSLIQATERELSSLTEIEPVSTTLLQPPVPLIEGQPSTGTTSSAPLEFDFKRTIPERMAEKASLQIKRIVDRGGIPIASHDDILNVINSTIISYFDSGMYEVKSYVELFESEQLALRLQDQETREKLIYRHNYKHRDGIYDDIFAGKTYQKLKKEGLFNNKYDIALLMAWDQFSPYEQKKNHSFGIIHFVVLNLDKTIRYQNKNMLTVALTPGPLSVKDLWSFLGPTMKDLDDLATKGIKVEIGKENIMVKAHLLGVTGDIPAIKTLANVQSHTSFFGCRICPLPGIHDENGFGMYFNDVDNEYNMEWRTKKEFLEGTGSGIVGPCKFAHLDTFLSAEFFTGDEMHMIGHGISHQFYDLLIGQYNLKTEGNKAHENPFQIDNIAKVLEIPLLKTSDARKAAMSLVRACQTALSYSITRQQVDVVESDIKEWHSYLRTLINSQILSVSVLTPNQHYLSHVP